MQAATSDPIQEALTAVGQYLSDTIPPFQAAEPVGILMQQPPDLTVSEILRWIPSQYSNENGDVPYVDYLFHAVSKLHYLGRLQLIAEQALTPYLNSVKRLLLNHCPPGDRRMLQENFNRLGTAEDVTVTPIGLIHSHSKPGESGTGRKVSSESSRERRASLLKARLHAAARQADTSTGDATSSDIIPNVIAATAAAANSSDEFRRLQENLKSLGIASGTDSIYRALSKTLPGWLIPSTGEGIVQSTNPAVEAMGQIIRLAEDRWEGCKRFQDLVQAAVELFNSGAYARAATMFDLALVLSSENKVEPSAVMNIRRTAHENLDQDKLRALAKDPDRHPLLLKVLNFFDEFTVKNMLENLRKEERRERRRFLLDLIEVWGEPARTTALENLRTLLATTNVAMDWHFARNLICILNRIPRTSKDSPKAEVEMIGPLLRLSLPTPLMKEAIKLAGQCRCPEAEELLISTADRLETALVESGRAGKDTASKLSLLDRTIFALAHFGTPKAYGRVIRHSTNHNDALGDNTARLAYLAGQDLSTDPESVSTLIQFLKSNLPRKLLGFTFQKNEPPILYTIKALSSTPLPAVRQMFENVSSRFPETTFGKAAAAALKEFEATDKAVASVERALTGDLELFGLPDLLRQLSLMRATGTLTLRDLKGNATGFMALTAGRMQDCQAGHLTGVTAAYQLIEKPMAGTFFFQGRRETAGGDTTPQDTSQDLSLILEEGLRRYDELQRSRALVPDFCTLRRSIAKPFPFQDQGGLMNLLWQKTAAGVSPEECEAVCPEDAYRVRSILAHWVEQGLLEIE